MAFPTQSADIESGSSQLLYAGDSASLSITSDLTAEAWIKIESSPASGALGGILSKRTLGGGGNNRSWGFALFNNSGTLQLFWTCSSDGTSGTNTNCSVDWTWSTGTWYHVAAVYDASAGSVSFFVDGVQQGTTQTGLNTSLFDGTSRTMIGAGFFDGSSYGDFYDGRVVLARVWSETRTGTQLGDNKCTVLGTTTNLAAEWTLDNTLNDNSGNSNTLTNVNTVVFGADVPATCSGGGGITTSSRKSNLLFMGV